MKRGRIGFMLLGMASAMLGGWPAVLLAAGALLVVSGAVDTIREEIRR